MTTRVASASAFVRLLDPTSFCGAMACVPSLRPSLSNRYIRRRQFVKPGNLMSSSGDAFSEGIPRDTAIRLCNEIRATKERKLFSQCWGCVKFSKGVFDKMCAAGKPDYRGCKLVNSKYDLGEE